MTHRFLSPYLRCISLICLALFGLSGVAQTTGSISGTVKDASGAVLKGATVELINTDRNATVTTLTTNGSGYYTGTSLPLGTYSVRITSPGFQAKTVSHLVLHVSDALTVNQTLIVGDANQSTTVTADEARVNLEDATAAGLINATQINELVLTTRNYEQLLELQPGVAYGGSSDQIYVGPTNPSGGSNQVSFSVNGGRNTSNNWTIDGSDNVDRGANLTLLTFPSADAIAEFKTLRGQYSAEYGRSASGQIDVVTKSGSNAIHGSAYEFIRNEALDANGYYNDFYGVKKQKYRYNDFGFSFGGPVYIPKIYDGHDKTFFFISEEWRRFVTYTTGAAYVPTADERNGDFSNAWTQNADKTGYVQGPTAVCVAVDPTTGTCTQSGTKVASPTSATVNAYLKDLYSQVPTPPSAANAARNIDPHQLNSTLANTFNNDNTVVRIDQQIGQKARVFYRYLHDTFPTFQGAGTFTTVPIPGISATVSHSPGTQHLARGTYQFSPTTLLDMGYAYSNGSINTVPQGALLSSNSPDIKPTLPYTNVLGVIPTLSVGGMTSLGGAGVYNDHNVNHNAFGSVTKVLHNHTLIAGVTYDHFQKMENNNAGGNQGSFAFGSTANLTQLPGTTGTNPAMASEQAMANFLLNNVTPGSFSQTSNAVTVDIQEQIFEAYLQDNWKVTPRLTLNLGVRYSFFGQPTDGRGQLNNFDPSTYSDALAPTIDSTGAICLTGTCVQQSGQGSTSPNANADYYNTANYINGLIFAGPNYPNNQRSPYGNKVGNTDSKNFAPRIGFALDVFGDGKTALRGGYGISYDESAVSYYETQIFNNPPATTTFSNGSATGMDNPANVTGKAVAVSLVPGRIQATPINYQTPYVQQYSLDVQQAVTPTFMLDIGYYGNRGTHLLGLLDINESEPGAYAGKVSPAYAVGGTAACGYQQYKPTTPLPSDIYQQYAGTPALINSTCDRVINQIRPYKGYFAIDAVRSIFSSNYNSLQVKATKHFSGKTYIDVNYTWSRNLTNSQNDYSTPPQNTFNINQDYGRAALDRNTILSMDGVYELPWYREQKGLKGHLIGGWEVSAIYALNSGMPLTATASSGAPILYGYSSVFNNSWSGGYPTDNAGLGILGNTNAGLRPNQLGNPNNGYGRKIHTRTEWFYRGAFAAPAPTSLVPGNEKRGTINGPGFNRLDLGVFRNFRLYNRLNFQFRAEATNVANHTNANSVVTSVTSSLYGQVTGWRDPRIVQFAGKFTF